MCTYTASVSPSYTALHKHKCTAAQLCTYTASSVPIMFLQQVVATCAKYFGNVTQSQSWRKLSFLDIIGRKFLGHPPEHLHLLGRNLWQSRILQQWWLSKSIHSSKVEKKLGNDPKEKIISLNLKTRNCLSWTRSGTKALSMTNFLISCQSIDFPIISTINWKECKVLKQISFLEIFSLI